MSEAHDNYAPRLGLVTRWRTRNGGLLLAPIWAMVAFGLALPMFNHVGWVLALVGLAAVAAGSVLGGADRSAGAEEYVMALPPSRHEQYWMRALLGLVIPIAALVGVVIVKYNVPAALWGMLCSSGWNVPMGEGSSRAFVIAAIVVPTALFAVCYAGATSGGVAGGLLSALVVAAACGASAMVEALLWEEPSGHILLPVVAGLGALALAGGYPIYLRRDVVAAGQRSQMTAVVVVVVVLVVLAFLLLSVGVRSTEMHHELQSQSEATEAAQSIDLVQPPVVEGGE